MMYVKFHRESSTIVAICDQDIIGKEFHEGKFHLQVSESFYKGELKTEEEVREIMLQFSSLNIVGKESINLALALGVISPESLLTIQGVPHAQTLSL